MLRYGVAWTAVLRHARRVVVLVAVGFLLCQQQVGFATEPPITDLAFSPDGESLVACSQAGVRVYAWPELQLQHKLKLRMPNPHDLAFSPDGERLAIVGGSPADNGTVEVFSWPERESIAQFYDSADSEMAVLWTANHLLVTSSLDHQVRMWDLDTKSVTKKLSGHSRGVLAIASLPGQKSLISAGIDQSLRVWDLDSGELIHSLSIHTKPVRALAVRPAQEGLAMVASASSDRTVRLWQPTIGRMVRFARLKSQPLCVEWILDGSAIVAGCTDGHIRFIDPEEVSVTRDQPIVDGWAYSLAVHPSDGSLAVGGSNATIRRVEIGGVVR